MRFLERVPELLDAPDVDPVQFAYAISRRLGTRTEKWRYYLHLVTQFRLPRTLRRKLTAARRARRERQHAKSADFAAQAEQPVSSVR